MTIVTIISTLGFYGLPHVTHVTISCVDLCGAVPWSTIRLAAFQAFERCGVRQVPVDLERVPPGGSHFQIKGKRTGGGKREMDDITNSG